jgi:hypothetical protein
MQLEYFVPRSRSHRGELQTPAQLARYLVQSVPLVQDVPDSKARAARVPAMQIGNPRDLLARPNPRQVLQAVEHNLAAQAMALDVEQPRRIRLIASRDLQHAGD